MIRVYCDGSILGNPGGHGYTGFVVYDIAGKLMHKHSDDLGIHPQMSNNVAEYCAVLSALNWLMVHKYSHEELRIHTDSQLVVRQLNGVWGCYQSHLSVLKDHVLTLSKTFKAVSFVWIRREQNTEADAMSKSLWKT